jgi:1,4-dihydroxy-2-naphthoyl-CoA hydrolase
MRIWSLSDLQALVPNTIMEQLGITFVGMGEDWLSARMPVDSRTHQTYGLLHGGASAVLIETLASVAAQLSVDRDAYRCFGLEINANHVRAVAQGWVTGTARAIHVGRTTQIWDVRIVDEQERLVCIGRLTVAVRPATGAPGAPLVPHASLGGQAEGTGSGA